MNPFAVATDWASALGRALRMKRSQRGLSLIETALVLAIVSLALVYFSRMMSDNAELVRAKGVAEKMIEVHQAATAYVKTYNSELMNAATAGSVVVIPAGRQDATAGVPNGPSAALPSLQGAGTLSLNFVDRNGYNQRHALLVRRVTIPATGEAALDAVVSTYGGTAIPDRQLGKVASYIGAVGGYVPLRDNATAGVNTTTVYGSFGGWRTAISNWAGAGSYRPAPGSIVSTLAFNGSRGLAEFLYRNDIGNPEANRMNTAIDMNGNNLNRAANVGADNVTVTNNVSANGSVSAGIDVWAAGTVSGQNVAARDSVYANNNVVANNTIQGTTAVGTNLVWSGGNVAAPYGDVSGNTVWGASGVWSGGNVSATNGTVSANNVSSRFVDVNTMVYDNTGRWGGMGERAVRLGDLLPKVVMQGVYNVNANDYVVKPSCGSGGTPGIMVSARFKYLTLNTGGVPGWAVGWTSVVPYDVGGHWIIRTEDPFNAWPAVDTYEAKTYCQYA